MPPHFDAESERALDTGPRRAFIFDMDGVLVDSEPLHLRATNEVLARAGAALSPVQNRAYLGTNERSYWTDLKARFDLQDEVTHLMEAKREATHRLLREELPVMEGVVDFVAEAAAQGFALAVASGSDRELVEYVLAASGLDRHIETIAAGDEVTRPKPDPEIYLLAAARLGVHPRDAIVFEDSVNGARSAAAAGMTCYRVVTETTRHLDFPPTAGEVHSFRDLRVDGWTQGSPSRESETRGGGANS